MPEQEGRYNPEDAETSPEKSREYIYNFPRNQKLVEPIGKVFSQIKQRVIQGEYNLVIGDDARARIPTLIIREVMNKLVGDNKREFIKTIFLAGGGMSQDITKYSGPASIQKRNETLEYLQNQAKNIEGMGHVPYALLVTEVVETGKGLAHIIEALRTAGISFEIAVLSGVKSTDKNKSKFEEKLGGPIICGDSGPLSPMGGGVQKRYLDTFARPKKEFRSYPANLPRYLINKHFPIKPTTEQIIDSYLDPESAGIQIPPEVLKYYSKEENQEHDEYLNRLQEDIRKAREDVHVAADEIFEKIST